MDPFRRETKRAEDGSVLKTREDVRRISRVERLECIGIHVVLVITADRDCVDCRDVLNRAGHARVSGRAQPLNGGALGREGGIKQNAWTATCTRRRGQLHEKCGVP